MQRRMRATAAVILFALLIGWIAAPPPTAAQPTMDQVIGDAFTFAQQQTLASASKIANNRYPFTTDANGNWLLRDVSPWSWAAGYYPGSMWHLYEYSKDSAWRTQAQNRTAPLDPLKTDTSTHDLGFILFDSFGNGYRLSGSDPTRQESYRQTLVTAAGSVATRYSSTVQSFRSWNGPTGDFRVIIDNLPNLELLFWASKHGGKAEWYTMAVNHALRTRAEHVRADGSTYHLVTYSEATGAVKSKTTVQGYSNESTWSRGQAWAMYGFTMTYRETGDKRFLDTARKVSEYYLTHLDGTYVPYWDFQAPNIPNEPRDSSAAAVAASALVELSSLVTDPAEQARYKAAAEATIRELASEKYLAKWSPTPNQAILLHGTAFKTQGNYDTGIIWGDYYFLQAMMRYRALAPGYPIMVSQQSNRANAVPLSGQAVSGLIYPFIAAGTNIKQVSFWLDNTARAGAPYHTESAAPYDFVGGDVTTARPLDTSGMAPGYHMISANVTRTDGTVAVVHGRFLVGTPPSFTPTTTATVTRTPTGTTTATATATPTVTPTATPSGDPYALQLSLQSSRAGAVPLDGAAVSGSIYVFIPAGTNIKQVSFWVDNPARSGTAFHTESLAPWDLMGGTATAATAYATSNLRAGHHMITAQVTLTDGSVVVSHALFRVGAPQQPAYPLQLSLQSDRSGAVPLNGATVSGNIYVFIPAGTNIKQVSFWVDNPARSGTAYRTESGAPYDLASGTATVAYAYPTAGLRDGYHLVSALVTRTDGTTAVVEAMFRVDN